MCEDIGTREFSYRSMFEIIELQIWCHSDEQAVKVSILKDS